MMQMVASGIAVHWALCCAVLKLEQVALACCGLIHLQDTSESAVFASKWHRVLKLLDHSGAARTVVLLAAFEYSVCFA